MMKKRILICLIILGIGAGLQLSKNNVSAGSTVDNYQEGIQTDDEENFIVITHDAKASSSIRYRTIGWNITDNNNRANTIRIKLPAQEQYPDPNDSDYVYTKFVLTKEYVFGCIARVNQGWFQELVLSGGDVIFDAVMVVVSADGVLSGSLSDYGLVSHGTIYETLSGITNAVPWRDPSGLVTHFNIPFRYNKLGLGQIPVNNQPVNTSVSQSAEGTTEINAVKSTTFDARQGIPTGEKVYTKGVATMYYIDNFLYQKVQQSVSIPVTVNVSYKVEMDGKDQYLNLPITTNVVRYYSYYKIISYEVYDLDSIEVENYCLPSNKEKLESAISQTVVYNKNQNIVSQPSVGSASCSSLDGVQSAAESAVGEFKVRSDELEINGMMIMDGSIYTQDGGGVTPHLRTWFMDETILKSNIDVLDSKKNKECPSKSIAKYVCISSNIGSNGDEKKINLTVNDVVIHTPVVCNPEIESDYSNNQQVTLNTSLPSLILDQTYKLNFKEEAHRSIPGYGTGLFEDYTYKKQVKFPFEVYVKDNCISKDTWIDVEDEEFEFKVAKWAEENDYTIEFRTIAKNYISNSSWESLTQKSANKDLSNYVATKSINVNVSGTMYDFSITDINDYPNWENIFRLPNSIAPTGNKYTVGLNDRYGVPYSKNNKLSLPIINGSHLTASNNGAVKLGYTFRFTLTTNSSLTNNQDYIQIIPTFYYVSKDGSKKQEVDLYYNEKIDDKKNYFVKVGSILDHTNVKYMTLGNVYNNVTNTEITQTSQYMGVSEEKIKYTSVPLFNYNLITIPSALRTFIGTTDNVPGRYIDDAIKSTQKWYGMFNLPAETFAVTKGYNILSQAKAKGGLTGKEDFWLNDGYILVNFDIISYKKDSASGQTMSHLSYINEDNYKNYGANNMWKTEGFNYSKKDSDGETFSFDDGDIMFMYTIYQDGHIVNASKDYTSRGTH